MPSHNKPPSRPQLANSCTMKMKSLKKIILVIEDERALLNVISAKLEKSGFKVITARGVDQVFTQEFDKKNSPKVSIRTITQALDFLSNLKTVDALWLDHNLEGKENGLDLIVKLKANGGKWKEIPIFVVSNTENPDTIQAYLDAGKSTYYLKSNHRLDAIVSDIQLFFKNQKPVEAGI